MDDFVDKALGRAIPYGVYDLTANQGWVSVGTDRDTAQCAVETRRRWGPQLGSVTYPMHDTFNRVFRLLDPEALGHCLVSWSCALAELSHGEVVALDSKSVRQSCDTAWG